MMSVAVKKIVINKKKFLKTSQNLISEYRLKSFYFKFEMLTKSFRKLQEIRSENKDALEGQEFWSGS